MRETESELWTSESLEIPENLRMELAGLDSKQTIGELGICVKPCHERIVVST
jgi:hypothetical protein